MNSLLAPMYATEKKVPAFAFVIMQKKKNAPPKQSYLKKIKARM